MLKQLIISLAGVVVNALLITRKRIKNRHGVHGLDMIDTVRNHVDSEQGVKLGHVQKGKAITKTTNAKEFHITV